MTENPEARKIIKILDEVLDWTSKESVSYEKQFKELRDQAIESQKAYTEGSIIFQQYQIFIDVGNEMLKMTEKRQESD